MELEAVEEKEAPEELEELEELAELEDKKVLEALLLEELFHHAGSTSHFQAAARTTVPQNAKTKN